MIDNVFEEEPPIVDGEIATTSSNGGNTFPRVHDSLGRVFTIRLKVKFLPDFSEETWRRVRRDPLFLLEWPTLASP